MEYIFPHNNLNMLFIKYIYLATKKTFKKIGTETSLVSSKCHISSYFPLNAYMMI